MHYNKSITENWNEALRKGYGKAIIKSRYLKFSESSLIFIKNKLLESSGIENVLRWV